MSWLYSPLVNTYSPHGDTANAMTRSPACQRHCALFGVHVVHVNLTESLRECHQMLLALDFYWARSRCAILPPAASSKTMASSHVLLERFQTFVILWNVEVATRRSPIKATELQFFAYVIVAAGHPLFYIRVNVPNAHARVAGATVGCQRTIPAQR